LDTPLPWPLDPFNAKGQKGQSLGSGGKYRVTQVSLKFGRRGSSAFNPKSLRVYALKNFPRYLRDYLLKAREKHWLTFRTFSPEGTALALKVLE